MSDSFYTPPPPKHVEPRQTPRLTPRLAPRTPRQPRPSHGRVYWCIGAMCTLVYVAIVLLPLVYAYRSSGTACYTHFDELRIWVQFTPLILVGAIPLLILGARSDNLRKCLDLSVGILTICWFICGGVIVWGNVVHVPTVCVGAHHRHELFVFAETYLMAIGVILGLSIVITIALAILLGVASRLRMHTGYTEYAEYSEYLPVLSEVEDASGEQSGYQADTAALSTTQHAVQPTATTSYGSTMSTSAVDRVSSSQNYTDTRVPNKARSNGAVGGGNGAVGGGNGAVVNGNGVIGNSAIDTWKVTPRGIELDTSPSHTTALESARRGDGGSFGDSHDNIDHHGLPHPVVTRAGGPHVSFVRDANASTAPVTPPHARADASAMGMGMGMGGGMGYQPSTATPMSQINDSLSYESSVNASVNDMSRSSFVSPPVPQNPLPKH